MSELVGFCNRLRDGRSNIEGSGKVLTYSGGRAIRLIGRFNSGNCGIKE